MLLPSALPCDSSHSSQTPRLTRLQTALFASPPSSPPPQVAPQTAIGNIFSTCRSLQSLIANPPAHSAAQEPITPPNSTRQHLPSPPLAHAPSPLKLRLRSRKNADGATPSGEHGPARKRIVKRTASIAQQAPRGPNKRRRALDDDAGHEDDSDMEHETEQDDGDDSRPEPAPLHTPKRSRIAPEVIPLGLERADYHSLHSSFSSSFSSDSGALAEGDTEQPGTDTVVEGDGEAWSTEEDRILVELVLEKLKLTKSDWQDCARSLGKDRSSVGRRWKSLMINGDVGLKRTSHRRGRIHGTWR
ncbi:hypothetical protein B0J18DRAFT_435193 [Chaetomium sp. MPI-SDFR-AT-0129]|nr:hypothetical protein B0J18DRAFT_435193 [Chaetomium sp. MPI-SDFR-AT-0129]